MPNYTGCQCLVCQNTFQKDDDVVVCPDCGTPYHRSCYNAKGHCINTALHENGGSWQDLHRGKLEERECPNCHHINASDAVYCSVCHAPLRRTAQQNDGTQDGVPHINIMLSDGSTMSINPNDPCCGLDPEEDLDGQRLGDMAQFVGSNTLYYIPFFKRFKDTKKKVSVNLPCLLFPHLYFANRKMWLVTFLTILVMALCNIPSMLTAMHTLFQDEEQMEIYMEYGMDIQAMYPELIEMLETHENLLRTLDMVGYGLTLAIRLLLCVFANWLYYRHALKRVKRIRSSGAPPSVQAMLLRSDGGTNIWNIFGAAALSAAVSMFVAAAFLIPFML